MRRQSRWSGHALRRCMTMLVMLAVSLLVALAAVGGATARSDRNALAQTSYRLSQIVS